jgi:mono/diheme cytochrome c family protein
MKVTLLIAGGTLASLATIFSRTAPIHQETDGKTIYDENCKRCHGVIGTPPKTMKAKYPKIATFNAEFIAERSDDSVVKILTKGKGEDMKSFKDKLTPAEMAAVAKYVRQLGSKPGG